MILQSINDSKAAYEMGQFMAEITTKAFEPNSCKILLSDDQVISVARLVGTNSGNNGGKGGSIMVALR